MNMALTYEACGLCCEGNLPPPPPPPSDPILISTHAIKSIIHQHALQRFASDTGEMPGLLQADRTEGRVKAACVEGGLSVRKRVTREHSQHMRAPILTPPEEGWQDWRAVLRNSQDQFSRRRSKPTLSPGLHAAWQPPDVAGSAAPAPAQRPWQQPLEHLPQQLLSRPAPACGCPLPCLLQPTAGPFPASACSCHKESHWCAGKSTSHRPITAVACGQAAAGAALRCCQVSLRKQEK